MSSNMSTTLPTWQDLSNVNATITVTSGTVNAATSGLSTGVFAGIDQSSIHAKGNITVDGDLRLRGVSLHDQITMISDKLESIDDRLAILRPNPELEKQYDQLRLLRQQYMELERELIEQNLVFDVLSGKRIDPK